MRSLRLVAAGLLLVVAACASKTEATDDGRICTPGAYVYCRCEDRSEGTKLCQGDGKGFDVCKCDGASDFDEGEPTSKSDPLEPTEAGKPTGGASIENACIGKLGVILGSDADNDVYLASYKGDGAFDVTRGHPGVRSAVDMVDVGGSLVAAYRGNYDAIVWSKMEAGKWSAPFQIGAATSTTGPTMVGQNGGARLFYLANSGYHMATYGESGWDDGSAAAGDATGSNLGPPTAAVAGSSLVLAFASSDGSLTRQSLSSGQWSSAVKFTATAYKAQPNLVALEGTGTKDMLLVYTGNDLVLHFSAREASNKVWSTAEVVDTAASTANSPSESSLVALPGGKALLVYRGVDNRAWTSQWDATNGFSLPKQLGDAELSGPPVITRGHCGSDATIAYAKKDGGVELMRYTNNAFTGPFAISGINKATYVGVAEIP